MLDCTKFSLPLSSSTKNAQPDLPCLQPPAVWWQRPLVDSPRDLEEGFHWMHLSQRGVSICQLDGRDAQGPHITAGVVRVVVLLLAGNDLTEQQLPSK